MKDLHALKLEHRNSVQIKLSKPDLTFLSSLTAKAVERRKVNLLHGLTLSSDTPVMMSFATKSEVCLPTSCKHHKQVSFVKAKPLADGDRALPTLFEATVSSFSKL